MLERSRKHHGFADPPDRNKLAPPPSSSSPTHSAAGENGGNVDRLLFRNLVEMVPLVESLMDRRTNSSYSRRASMVYTPAPSQSRKVANSKGGKTIQSASAKKRRDLGENNASESKKDTNGDDYSIMPSRDLVPENVQKDREELAMLREQINDLQNKLLEKDEALKSAENSINQMNAAYSMLDGLRHQVTEKDSLIKSTNSQLHNAKIMLADKQATLEKLEWEAKMSNRKIEELQEDVASMDFEITALMKLFEELSENVSDAYPEDSISLSFEFEPLPLADDFDNIEVEKMELERAAYVAAVAAAKENPADEFLTIAAEARLRLRAFVL
ncbi:protein MICROTUBULE BINDING PROTEIN 2C isoform X2 [Typha latifolia]|uniref:protein MICROTUBULE BINDING PROTEIN 2C isoform X2 n=1 Tax=Typha latifolia TaxID=4733 RepID=UPI003C2C8E2A